MGLVNCIGLVYRMLWLLHRTVKPKFTGEIKRKYRENTRDKAKAISAELFELNLKVQLCNLVTV